MIGKLTIPAAENAEKISLPLPFTIILQQNSGKVNKKICKYSSKTPNCVKSSFPECFPKYPRIVLPP
jgi:hypothetical protein